MCLFIQIKATEQHFLMERYSIICNENFQIVSSTLRSEWMKEKKLIPWFVLNMVMHFLFCQNEEQVAK